MIIRKLMLAALAAVILLAGVGAAAEDASNAGLQERYWEVYFDFNKAAVTPVSENTLKDVILVMQENPLVVVEVTGHTCDLASSTYNSRLAKKRAQAVAAHLKKAGIPAQRIKVRAAGKNSPRYSNATEEGRVRNRRVELRLAAKPVATTPQPAAGPGVMTSYVTVLDDSGRIVPDLRKDNFRVIQGGKERDIVRVIYQGQEEPLSLCLVLDQSASMAGNMQMLKKAAQLFVKNKKENDRIQIVAFSSDIYAGNQFTTDATALDAVIDGLQAHGHTRLYDALIEGAKQVATTEPPRIIILLTDGIDEHGFNKPGSKATLDTAINFARMAHATVVAVGLGNHINKDVLATIGFLTDGAFFFLPNAEFLEPFYEKAARGITRGKYRIDFRTDPNADAVAAIECNGGHVIGLK